MDQESVERRLAMYSVCLRPSILTSAELPERTRSTASEPQPQVLLVVQTGPIVNGAPGIDGACHYLSLGISQSARSPSEHLHHLQQAYLWA